MVPSSESKRACIVVLGDIGRSPRMQYHAQSLIEEDYNVDIVGYVETQPLNTIVMAPKATIHEIFHCPEMNLPPALKYLFKTIWQTFTLLLVLWAIKRPNFMIVQNPPGVPTLAICYLYCLLLRSKLAIDWHNYTYTILALTARRTSLVVRLAYWIEGFCGRRGDAHFCVTKAMRDDLKSKWGIEAIVLYDRPPLHFQPISLEKKHELFMKLSQDHAQFLPKDCGDFKESGVLESTRLTQKLSNGKVIYKSERPAILVSSTSWTPDEDFSILLEALQDYEAEATKANSKLPNLLCVITGKGPLKKYYVQKIGKQNWKKVSVVTPWLEAEDYPLLLASAELGVCLHYSSSGLDLPMKVVDMFGCGLPVCAINFQCLGELVQHEKNGFIFENSKQLSFYIKSWFDGFPNINERTAEMKQEFEQNLKVFQSLRWRENWKLHALPTLRKFND
ncbi:unnamed protein product [Hermetia illucens]|uniref:Chitobiosyldiphosphodolichol beta-mannosyltransferase n=1 Tax=Hermetia illucens TaxID=343691 RepID=A0A7R8Z2Y3_HERIL|nr:chitobiosyldiphosphodolichol beta-mannosyltransferase [Hermetia illucens]CAD7093348.1 unnamed protein product [Hermetia illucens]